MKTPTILVLGTALLALQTSPAQGQLFGRIKEMAARKVAEAAAERVAKATQAGSAAIDSTVDKGGRQFDSAVVRSGDGLKAAVRSESAGDIAQSSDSAVSRISAELSLGRLSLDALRFDDGDRLDAASSASLKTVARAMKGTIGGYVVKVRIASTTGAQQHADRRAAAIRVTLVAEGVEAERLFSAGVGESGGAGSRVEILRIK